MKNDPRAPVKFLLVDDLEENLVALRALLRRPHLELLLARSGREALELLLEHEVALALLDVQMPEMDGFELAELMRGSARTSHVPIIFVTAGAQDRGRIFKGYDAGAVDFLFKPIDAHILRSKARVFFQLHEQRVELERQLARVREVEEFRERMLEASRDCIAVLDKNGRITAFHGSQTEALSAALGPLEGVAFADLFVDGAEAIAAAITAGFDEGLGRFTGQSEKLTSEGPSFWEVVISRIGTGTEGEPRVLAVARDVTEQRRLNTELQETLRLNETFVAAVGHDLRNPLNAVMIGADLLCQSSKEEATRAVAERVRSSGKRMSRMIDDLFDLARARLGGGIPISVRGSDLGEVARRAVGEVQAVNPERRIALSERGSLSGTWDPDRLAQVLSNLIGNAVRHGGAGDVLVHVDGEGGEQISVRVENQGLIPEAIRARLFDPFRGDRDGVARKEGLGLGLYIVQQIVSAHAGKVSFESSDDRTVFQLDLPRMVPPRSPTG